MDPVRSQAREALAVAMDLRRAVREDRRRPALVALLVMGALFTLAGIVYRVFPAVPPQLVPGSGGGYRIPREDPWLNLGGQPPHVAATWFWVLGIPTAWVLCGWLFQRRRERGLGSPGGLIAGIGILPFAVLAVTELIVAPHVLAVHQWLDNPARQVMPATAVAVGLALIAAWERHVWLGVVAALFAAGPQLVAGQWHSWLSVAWGHEVINVDEALLWWGLAMLTVVAAWWTVSRLTSARRG
jgi:hypothetical protein